MKRFIQPASNIAGGVAAVVVIAFAAYGPFNLGRGQQLSPPRISQAQPPPDVPQLVDITPSTKIHFDHLSTPEQKYILESMSGGITLIDYDRDGWPDIYFTNAPSVDMALAGKKWRSALYHNNRDGTFTDVTEKAGIGFPCSALGAVAGLQQ